MQSTRESCISSEVIGRAFQAFPQKNPIPIMLKQNLLSSIRCSLLCFYRRQAHLLRDPDRAPEPEVEAPETDDE